MRHLFMVVICLFASGCLSEALETQNRQLQTRFAEQGNELRVTRAEVDQLRQELRTLQSVVSAMVGQMDEAVRSMRRLEPRVERAETRLETVATDTANNTSRLEQIDTTAAQLQPTVRTGRRGHRPRVERDVDDDE